MYDKENELDFTNVEEEEKFNAVEYYVENKDKIKILGKIPFTKKLYMLIKDAMSKYYGSYINNITKDLVYNLALYCISKDSTKQRYLEGVYYRRNRLITLLDSEYNDADPDYDYEYILENYTQDNLYRHINPILSDFYTINPRINEGRLKEILRNMLRLEYIFSYDYVMDYRRELTSISR